MTLRLLALLALTVAASAQAEKRIFLITDAEGVAGICRQEQTDPKDPELRALLTGEINAAVEGFLAGCDRYFRRYLRLCLVLTIVYVLSGGLYLAIVFGGLTLLSDTTRRARLGIRPRDGASRHARRVLPNLPHVLQGFAVPPAPHLGSDRGDGIPAPMIEPARPRGVLRAQQRAATRVVAAEHELPAVLERRMLGPQPPQPAVVADPRGDVPLGNVNGLQVRVARLDLAKRRRHQLHDPASSDRAPRFRPKVALGHRLGLEDAPVVGRAKEALRVFLEEMIVTFLGRPGSVLRGRGRCGDDRRRWIYVHDSRVKVGRIQNYNNWSPEIVPDPETTCLGLEYFCFEGDGLWTMRDQDLIELGKKETAALGLVDPSLVVDGTVVRMPKAYPVYDAVYRRGLDAIRRFLATVPNLQLVGRNGMHRYNNQDHSMLTAILAARNVLGGRYDLWRINVDADYHEEGASLTEDDVKAMEATAARPCIQETYGSPPRGVVTRRGG